MRRFHSALRTPHSELRSLKGVTIGVIGAGTMGRAMMKGFLAQGFSRAALTAADPQAATRKQVSRRFQIHVSDDNVAVVERSNVVILAVKPQQMPEVIAEIAPHVTRHHLVLSIAAGIPLRWFEARVPGVPIVRVMPNLPATVGCGYSAITGGRLALPRHRAMASALLGAVGEVISLPERHFDAVTAVSGSGPAYLFFFVQAWEEAARSLQLPAHAVARAIRQTLKGSLRLLEESGEDAATLIQRVASKGGTTEAALKVLARRRVAASFGEALRAAARRSKELSWI